MNAKVRRVVLVSTGWLSCIAATLCAAELSPGRFEKTHQLILPQSHESQWLQIPWLTVIQTAREQAAAQGKPILIWSGGGAPPIGGC